jgi:hypothetical protein
MTIRLLPRTFASGAVALALSMAGAAHAAEYDLQFIGANVSGNVFAMTNGSNVTAIWGTVTDLDLATTPSSPTTFAVSGLSGYASSDNTLVGSSPYLTLGGLSFSTSGGGDFNLANLDGFENLSGFTLLSSDLNPGGGVSNIGMTSVTLSVTAVPEPGNLALMLAGALGLFGVTRRRAAR